MPKRIALLLCALLGLTSCAGTWANEPNVSYSNRERVQSAGDQADTARLEIRTATQRVTVDDVLAATESVRSVVDDFHGRIDTAQTGNEDRAHFVLRVPASSLDAALDQLASLGDEEFRRVDAEDVTERFADTEARRNNLATLRDRLRSLLDRAKTVEEILKVERELTRVQTELDALDGRLERLRSDIRLSRVELTLDRRGTEEILGPLGWVVKSSWWFVQKLFVLREGR
jgi:chromosome segregation ATPase